MSEFDELVASPGVLMACRFGADGRVAEHKTTSLYIENPAPTGIAQWFCAAVTTMFGSMGIRRRHSDPERAEAVSEVTVASATGRDGRPVHGGKVGSWLSKVFELNAAAINWPRAVMILDVLLVPLVVFWAIGYEQYLLSAVFGVLFAALADPGGAYWQRAFRIFVFGAIGAGLTALGFGIGGDAWGWLVLAAFAVTLVAGLAVMFGVHRFVAAFLLNIWFIVALAIAFSLHHHTRITQYTWAQTVAWAGGSVLWIVVTFIAWLVRGRHDERQPIAEMPGDTSRRNLTPPLITFAVLRALVMAGTVAIAFGATSSSHGYWMAIGAIVAMKPSLEESTLIAVQRVAGALIGGVAAGLLLLIPANVHGLRLFAIDRGLEVVALVLLIHGWRLASTTTRSTTRPSPRECCS